MPPPIPRPDAQLVDSAYAYACSLVHDQTRAADLVQDVLERCVRVQRDRLARDEPPGDLWNKAYLFTALRNRAIDLARRQQVIEVGDAPLEVVAAPDLEPEPDPARLETLVRDHPRLEAALGTLTMDEREVFFLKAVEGYTAQEIALHTGRSSENTVSSLYRRARIKLLRALEAPGEQSAGGTS
jgi:RNA polymerase sigma-70 factor (ECF subfamily)